MTDRMYDVINVAWSTKRLRNHTISQCTAAMAKAFDLTPEETYDLEGCLIEFVLGISSLKPNFTPTLTVRDALDLLEENARQKGDTTDLGRGDSCSTKVVSDVLKTYIANQTF